MTAQYVLHAAREASCVMPAQALGAPAPEASQPGPASLLNSQTMGIQSDFFTCSQPGDGNSRVLEPNLTPQCELSSRQVGLHRVVAEDAMLHAWPVHLLVERVIRRSGLEQGIFE